MGEQSKIEWTDATWTPIRARNKKTGKIGWYCEHATTGCEFCYAEGMNKFVGTGLPFKPGHLDDVEIFLDEKMLLAPFGWKRPKMVFTCSMTDLFARFVKTEWIDKIFAVMAMCPQHTFQVLTKRADRLYKYMTLDRFQIGSQKITTYEVLYNTMGGLGREHFGEEHPYRRIFPNGMPWPLRNVWLGVSAERQQEADERISLLMQTPAFVRFVSAEPLLGPINLRNMTGRYPSMPANHDHFDALHQRLVSRIDWVIVGGESGRNARPMHLDWARSLRDQCAEAKVKFFFKQFGEWLPWSQFNDANIIDDETQTRFKTMEWENDRWKDVGYPMWCDSTDGNIDDEHCVARVGKKSAGRLLDGREHNGMPFEANT